MKILSIISGPYYLEDIPNGFRNSEYIGYLLCRIPPINFDTWKDQGDCPVKEVWFKDYKYMESVIRHFQDYPNQSLEV